MHHPLAFLSGTFTKNQTNWPIVEKEGYAVVQLDRVRYLLQGRRIHIFTDHRNLQYIWGGHPATVSKAASQRLQNWQGILSTFEYTIEHIPGRSSHWGDMLSRWLGEDISKKVIAVKLMTIQRGKTYDSAKVAFPDLTHLRNDQLDELDTAIANGGDPDQIAHRLGLERDKEKILLTYKGRVWVPSSATQLSLLVLAHQGIAGHRATKATARVLKEHGFWWPAMEKQVKQFVTACLQCLDVGLGEKVPRPYGEQVHETQPYEVIHFDYLYVGESDAGYKYLFICHDDFSGQVTLVPSYGATSLLAATTLIQLFSKFGVARTWVSDRGSHFQNEVLREFRDLVRADHHIVVAYSLWANGPSERMVKESLRMLRSLCSEYQQPFGQWPALVPVAELALNTVVSPLRGKSAIEIVTGRQDTHPLSAILLQRGQQWSMEPINIGGTVCWKTEVHARYITQSHICKT